MLGRRQFSLKPGYRARVRPHASRGANGTAGGDAGRRDDVKTRLPDLPAFAAFLGRRRECRYAVGIGRGALARLGLLQPHFEVIGMGPASDRLAWRESCPTGTWIEWSFDRNGLVALGPAVLSKSVVICVDALEHLVNPTFLLKNLIRFMDHAPICLIATPERDLVAGPGDMGPPADPSHVREWNINEFEALLSFAWGFNVAFVGLTVDDNVHYTKNTILAVLENNGARPTVDPTRPDFRVVALMAAYNEEDIIVPSLEKLTSQGIQVYLLDNWSTDRTYELVQPFVGKGLIRVERFPHSGPSRHFNLRERLVRMEQLAQELDADWFMFQDVDEVRRPPWPGMSLKDAIYRVDRAGYNCIDHTSLLFHPTDDGFEPGTDFESYFKRYEVALHRGWTQVVQMKAWKNTGRPISLAGRAGHEVVFEGRRVYPYNFLNKHYPIRSQAHGERKVFQERKARWVPEWRSASWHAQYSDIEPGYNFIHDPGELWPYEEDLFNRRFLVERLSSRRWA